MKAPTRVLVTPLDWGLGHATRCIPIIRMLLSRHLTVSIASNGNALALLKKEFPMLRFFELPGYDVQYPRHGSFTMSLFQQVPRLLKVIRQEYLEVNRIVEAQGIDVIVSDNRFGCWSGSATSVIIAHQLHILTPAWLKPVEPIINFYNRRLIKRFDFCWIPDVPNGLTGKLSHSTLTSTRHIGWLSRFSPGVHTSDKKFVCTAVLSGPEPQRTLFEEMVRKEFLALKKPCAIVRGLPAASEAWTTHDNIQVVAHLPSKSLETLIKESEWIVARSGYSTIMDLACAGARAIFVPTPGQTEQEYLANKLDEEGIAFYQKQSEFSLSKALQNGMKYSGFEVKHHRTNLLHIAMDEIFT